MNHKNEWHQLGSFTENKNATRQPLSSARLLENSGVACKNLGPLLSVGSGRLALLVLILKGQIHSESSLKSLSGV